MSDAPYVADWVMLSNFGAGDGGRETWAYNFLPSLLASDPRMTLRLWGMRAEGQPDTAPALLAAMAPEDRDRLEPHFFTAKRSRLPLALAMLRQLRAHMKRADVAAPRFVIAASSIMEQVMVLASPKLRRGFKIVWLRCLYVNEKSKRVPRFLLPLIRRAEASLHRRADLVIANGDDIAEYYGRYGLKVHVVRNGVDLTRWHLPPPVIGSPVRIGYIGRLTGVKGIAEFLAAARLVKAGADADRFEFHIIGAEGPYEAEAKAAAADGVLIYHGMVPNTDLPAMLATIDVCVALTRAAGRNGGGGTSNAMMEQMAAARVIVAWDNVIFRQVLDEENAYLVAQDDIDGLAVAFRAIAADPARAAERAAAGQRTVGRFSNEGQFALFQSILAAQPKLDGLSLTPQSPPR